VCDMLQMSRYTVRVSLFHRLQDEYTDKSGDIQTFDTSFALLTIGKRMKINK
jgi:hypothetical protein